MRRRQEEEEDEHTIKYNQTKGLTPWPVYKAD